MGVMTDDQRFRWILLAGLVLVLPIGIYHRLKAHTGERIDRRQEGWLLAIRPLALIGMGGVIAFLIHPPWMAWSSLPLPAWARWTGVGLGILTAALLIWTFRNLGKNITDTVVTREKHALVTAGPYRWVRHPFYVSFLLGVVANSLVMANWFVFACGVTAFILLAIRSRIEEDNLLARFGDDYRRYRERTGAFFPRLRS
jgi:protein-S-isoprenylcysteine O-methyltransferase Ste14